MVNRDWKAITVDDLALQDYDNIVGVNRCLTQRQVAIIKALLIPMDWATRWTNLTQSIDSIQEFIADIHYRLDGVSCGDGDNMLFRDNPNDFCEVQYSTDGGLIWSTMFRKDNCAGQITEPGSVTEIEEGDTTIITNNIVYNNSITNIAPNWGYGAGQYTDAERDAAMCWAIHKHVDWVCEMRIQQIRDGNQLDKELSEYYSDASDPISAVVIGVIAVSSGGTAALAAACAWAVAKMVVDVITAALAATTDTFEDLDAREYVACAMLDFVQGETPQFARWSSSLNGFLGRNQNEIDIGATVHQVNQDEDFYVNYLLLMEQVIPIALSLPACACPDRWEHTWDFENVGMDTWIFDGLGGEYQVGVGAVATIVDLGGGVRTNMIQFLQFPELVQRCDKWTLYTTVVRGNFDDPGLGYAMAQPPLAVKTWNNGFVVTGTPTRVWAFDLTNLDYVRVDLAASDFTEFAITGTMIITSIKLEGEGIDPFAGRITS